MQGLAALVVSDLPHCAQFTDLMMDYDEEFRVDADDVEAFFYMLRWPECRWSSNAMGCQAE